MEAWLFEALNAGDAAPVLQRVAALLAAPEFLLAPACVTLVLALLFGNPQVRRLLWCGTVAFVVYRLVLAPWLPVRPAPASLAGTQASFYDTRLEVWLTLDPTGTTYAPALPGAGFAPTVVAAGLMLVLAIALRPRREEALWFALPVGAHAVALIATGRALPLSIVAGLLLGLVLGGAAWAAARLMQQRDLSPPLPALSVRTLGRERLALAGLALALAVYWALLGALKTIDLHMDEAYYYAYGQQLDWGYHSKPPLVMYLMRLGAELFGASTHSTRLAVHLGHLAQLPLVFWLVRQLGCDERAALLAATVRAAFFGVSNNVVPLATTMDLEMTFALATLVAYIRAMHTNTWRWWLVAGACLGLAILARWSAASLLAGFALHQALRRRPLPEYRMPCAAALLAVAFCTPYMLWQWANDWITFGHTAALNVSDTQTWAERAASMARFFTGIGGLLNVVTPVFLAGLGVILWHAPRRPAYAAAAAASLPLLFFYFAISPGYRIEPSWLATPLLIITVIGIGAVGSWLKARWLVSAAAVLALVALGFGAARLAWRPPYDTGRTLATLALEHLGDAPRASTLTGSEFYGWTALLGYYLPGQPEVFRSAYYISYEPFQYDLWTHWPDHFGKDMLTLVSWEEEPHHLRDGFAPYVDEVRIVDAMPIHYWRLGWAPGFIQAVWLENVREMPPVPRE